MFKLLAYVKSLLFEPIYIEPHAHKDDELPEYLSLRELSDLPPHHPCRERSAKRRR